MGIAEVTELVEKFVIANTTKKPVTTTTAKVYYLLSLSSSLFTLVLLFPSPLPSLLSPHPLLPLSYKYCSRPQGDREFKGDGRSDVET